MAQGSVVTVTALRILCWGTAKCEGRHISLQPALDMLALWRVTLTSQLLSVVGRCVCGGAADSPMLEQWQVVAPSLSTRGVTVVECSQRCARSLYLLGTFGATHDARRSRRILRHPRPA